MAIMLHNVTACRENNSVAGQLVEQVPVGDLQCAPVEGAEWKCGRYGRAIEVALERSVAGLPRGPWVLKAAAPEDPRDAEAARECLVWEREALAGQNRTPFLPTLAASGELSDGTPFLLMSPVGGRTLREALEEDPASLAPEPPEDGPLAEEAREALRRMKSERRLPVVTAVRRVALPLAEGLARLEERRFCHGDVSPSNVVVGEDGSVRMVDLGCLGSLGEEPRGKGTAPYVLPGWDKAPGGRPRDCRGVDAYALAVLLREMTGPADDLVPPAVECSILVNRLEAKDGGRRDPHVLFAIGCVVDYCFSHELDAIANDLRESPVIAVERFKMALSDYLDGWERLLVEAYDLLASKINLRLVKNSRYNRFSSRRELSEATYLSVAFQLAKERIVKWMRSDPREWSCRYKMTEELLDALHYHPDEVSAPTIAKLIMSVADAAKREGRSDIVAEMHAGFSVAVLPGYFVNDADLLARSAGYALKALQSSCDIALSRRAGAIASVVAARMLFHGNDSRRAGLIARQVARKAKEVEGLSELSPIAVCLEAACGFANNNIRDWDLEVLIRALPSCNSGVLKARSGLVSDEQAFEIDLQVANYYIWLCSYDITPGTIALWDYGFYGRNAAPWLRCSSEVLALRECYSALLQFLSIAAKEKGMKSFFSLWNYALCAADPHALICFGNDMDCEGDERESLLAWKRAADLGDCDGMYCYAMAVMDDDPCLARELLEKAKMAGSAAALAEASRAKNGLEQGLEDVYACGDSRSMVKWAFFLEGEAPEHAKELLSMAIDMGDSLFHGAEIKLSAESLHLIAIGQARNPPSDNDPAGLRLRGNCLELGVEGAVRKNIQKAAECYMASLRSGEFQALNDLKRLKREYPAVVKSLLASIGR